MSTAIPRSHRPTIRVPTRVSNYDRVSALLVAAIILVGFMVVLLFLIFLTTYTFRTYRPTALVEMAPYGDERPEGYEDDFYEPGVDDFPEVEVPQLAETLEALTEAASTVAADIDIVAGEAAEMGRGLGAGSREGGLGPGSANVLPEWQRWQVEYASTDIDLYASQLAFFGIELGAVHRAVNDIDVVGNLAASPTARRTTRGDETRVYFIYNQSRLRAWDEALVRRAGVDPGNKILVQFYPDATRAALATLELGHLEQHGQGRTLENVRRTVFRVRAVGNGFEYFVHAMDFR